MQLDAGCLRSKSPGNQYPVNRQLFRAAKQKPRKPVSGKPAIVQGCEAKARKPVTGNR
ncbi:hypothetical protein [Longitalea luteola]|uniref:hypothetical protein n=1 Tax=Longitalea luteola TaxID=2812563 RepID=UPI001A9688B9|nr:hypothetical protein [Longitalea luteola]